MRFLLIKLHYHRNHHLFYTLLHLIYEFIVNLFTDKKTNEYNFVSDTICTYYDMRNQSESSDRAKHVLPPYILRAGPGRGSDGSEGDAVR